MEYTYTTNVFQDNKSIRKDVTMKFAKVLGDIKDHTTYLVEVFDNVEKRVVTHLANDKDIQAWKDYIGGKTERPGWDIKERLHELETPASVTRPDAVNPAHYQGYMQDFQWLETMSRLDRYSDPNVFKAAVELQVRKYLDRLDKKGNRLEQLRKARWYINYLIAYENDPNFRIKDVEVLKNG